MLTERERVVLHHMMEGHCAEQIAAAEYVTVSTVRTHIRNILWKLDCKSQLAAVAYVRRMQTPCPDQRRQAVEAVLRDEAMA